MPSFRLGLTSTRSVSDWLPVPAGATKLSVTITDNATHPPTTTYTWGAAVVDLQYTVMTGSDALGQLLDSPQAFSPAVQFTTSIKSKRNIGVSAAGNVRLKVSTAISTADPNALVTYGFS